MRGVLVRDVDTQWGTYARGLSVEVLESNEESAEVVLSQLNARRRLTAWVPARCVEVASWL